MSTLAEVFHALNQAGVAIVPAGDKLQLRPASAVTPELRDAVTLHKAELMALLPPAGETDAEREALRWEGALTGKAAAVVAARAVSDWDAMLATDGQAVPAEPWDAAAAEALVRDAVDRWASSCPAADADAVRQRQEAGARLDTAIDARDLAGLRREAESFRTLLAAALAPDPVPAAPTFPGVPANAAYDFTDGTGWRWFRVPGAVAREDSFTSPAWEDCIPATSGPTDDGAVPPIGATFYYADEAGRPCTPAAAYMWTWTGAASWHYSRERPAPEISNRGT